MKSKNCVYLLTTNDNLELPVFVADTLDEISKKFNIPYFVLYRHCERNVPIANKYRIRQVDIREPFERFLFKDYKDFCKQNNLKESKFSSLQRFRAYCYGT